MSVKPDRPCRYKPDDRVHVLDAFDRPHKQGKVTSCKWNSDGSDIGWWMHVTADDGSRYVCHEADIRKVQQGKGS